MFLEAGIYTSEQGESVNIAAHRVDQLLLQATVLGVEEQSRDVKNLGILADQDWRTVVLVDVQVTQPLDEI